MTTANTQSRRDRAALRAALLTSGICPDGLRIRTIGDRRYSVTAVPVSWPASRVMRAICDTANDLECACTLADCVGGNVRADFAFRPAAPVAVPVTAEAVAAATIPVSAEAVAAVAGLTAIIGAARYWNVAPNDLSVAEAGPGAFTVGIRAAGSSYDDLIALASNVVSSVPGATHGAYLIPDRGVVTVLVTVA